MKAIFSHSYWKMAINKILSDDAALCSQNVVLSGKKFIIELLKLILLSEDVWNVTDAASWLQNITFLPNIQ